MKVQLTWVFCILFLGCAQPRDIAVPDAPVRDSSNSEGAVGEPDVTENVGPGEGSGETTPDSGRGEIDPEPITSNPDPKPDPIPDPTPDPEPDPVMKDPDIIDKAPDIVLTEFPGVHSVAATLQSYYNPTTALWPDGWWTSANSLTAIIDYMLLSGSREYVFIIDKTYEKSKAAGYINEFYDDSAWWALAWVKAYDLTKNPKYLETSKKIADYMMSKGWDSKCGGGIYWKTDHLTKNAVQNELYIKLAASLHNRIAGDTVYLADAKKAWNWFSASGLINSQNLINDALDANCKNNGDTTWSYNQGIILSALTELHKATGEQALLDKAKTLALASVKSLSVSGNIIKERNDPGCGTCKGDERIFKGAYVRGLRELNTVLKDLTIEDYLKSSANAAWTKSRTSYDRIGFRWEGPFDSDDASRQTSALDLFNSRIPVKARTNYAKNRPVTARASCAADQGPAMLVDGSAATKICSSNSGSSYIDIDLGSSRALSSIRILHAGAGNETPYWNTADFELLVSNSSTGAWTSVAKVVGNKSNATVHSLNHTARYIRLHVTQAGSDNIVRIYELVAE